MANGELIHVSMAVNGNNGMTDPKSKPFSSLLDGPVGQGDYWVEFNDCMKSIAKCHGFFWRTLWDLAENAEVKRLRVDPMVLRAGDRLTIPEKRNKEESGNTEKRHRYRRKGGRAKLRLRFLYEEEPRVNEPCKINIDGEIEEKTTDDDGLVEIKVEPDAKEGIIEIGEGENVMTFRLNLGRLEPHDSWVGVQQRLTNLGCYDGPIDGQQSESLREAIGDFQASREIEVTGELDVRTRDELLEAHGS